MILKYFKLSFSIRLLWQSRVTSKSPMFAICFTSYPTAVDALTQLYLRQVARKAPMQSEKQSNRQNKKVARKTAATLYFISSFPCTISRNFCDESQLKLRCRISHSQRKSDNLPRRVAYRNAYYAAVSFEIIQIVSSVTALHHVGSIQLF